MYSVVRHPLYLGNYFQWLGVAMLPRNPWVAVTVSLVFWIYYERIMFAEEEYLRRSFGSEFEEWAARTPAFIPDFAQWVPAACPSAGERPSSARTRACSRSSPHWRSWASSRTLYWNGGFLPEPFWVATFRSAA
jgi:hypothetical protein